MAAPYVDPVAPEPDFQPRRKLRWRLSRGRRNDYEQQRPVPGWVLPVVMGMGIVPIVATVSWNGGPILHEPPMVVVGGVFLLAGFVLLVRYLRQKRHGNVHSPAPDASEAAPWERDHAWDPAGTADSRLRYAGAGFVLAGFVLTIATIVVWPLRTIDIAMGGGLGLAGLGGLGAGIYFLAQWACFGRTWLSCERFPFHPGQTLEVQWHSPAVSRCQRLEFTLRYITEHIVEHNVGSSRRRWWVLYEHYSDRYQIDRPCDLPQGHATPITFLIPANAPGTSLASREPRYWELEVKVHRLGLNYTARYLVPIYSATEHND